MNCSAPKKLTVYHYQNLKQSDASDATKVHLLYSAAVRIKIIRTAFFCEVILVNAQREIVFILKSARIELHDAIPRKNDVILLGGGVDKVKSLYNSFRFAIGRK